MLFWLIIICVISLTLYLVWRSWITHLNVDLTVEQSEVDIYNSRLEEISRDLSSGRLDAEMAEAAKAEEARKLLKLSGTQEHAVRASQQPSGWWMTLGLFSIPLISVLIYLNLGTPPGLNDVSTVPEVAEQSMEQLIAAAERRLESNPDDLQGWQVLIPVYIRQQNFEKAENAFRNVLRLNGETTELLSAYGEVLVAKSQGHVTPEALDVFQKAVALDSRNTTARFFLGLSSFQKNDNEAAKTTWQQMLDDAQGDEEWVPAIKQRIAELNSVTTPSETNKRAQEIIALPEDEQRAQILSMVGRLADRLEENPDDQGGWLRLVQAYMVLGQKEDAEEALEKALDTFPNAPEFTAQLRALVAKDEGVSN